MKIKFTISVYLIYVILSVSCSLNQVSVVRFSPVGEVSKTPTFTIEFSKPLAPIDKQGKWLSEEFIRFEPALKGKYKWVNGSTLLFSPDFALEDMQDYEADITQKVLFNTGYSSDFELFEFHTPYFDVKKIDFFWTFIPNEEYKVSIQANIHLTYPVSHEQMRQHLKIEKDGEKYSNINIIKTSPSEMIAVNFGEMKQTDKEQKFKLFFTKGMKSVIGKKPLTEDREFVKSLQPITELTITGVTAGFDGTTGWIEVATTQRVDDKTLKDYVSLEPDKQLQFVANENSFRIETDLTDVATAELKIKKGLPGLYGGKLQDDFEQTVFMVNLEPSINFTDRRGKYLMLSGKRNLEVSAVNIDEAEIEVSQVFKNNILYFLDKHDYYLQDWFQEDYSYSPTYYADNFGRTLYTQKKDLHNNRNWLEKFTINLDSLKNKKLKGIFLVNVSNAEDRWNADSKMLAISDMGIIARKTGNSIMVFINSLATTQPVSDADISVISTNNQTILTGITDGDGIVVFNDIADKIKDFVPRMITCEKGDDFNYLDLKETEIETSRFDVGGLNEVSTEYSTFVYSDRDIYRPGENAYLTAIVRDIKMKVVKDIPVRLKIIAPTGRTFQELKCGLNEEGSLEQKIKIPEYAETGQYQAFIYSGIDKLIGNYKFNVEEFVPDKIRVILNCDKQRAFLGESVNVNINAEFLFGAKALGLRYEAVVQYSHKPFGSKNFDKYDFINSSFINENIPGQIVHGYLNDNGQSTINFTIPQNLAGTGFIECTFYISVFDLTGRTVSKNVSVDVYPKDYFIGILSSGYYFGVNDNLSFRLAVVNSQDNSIKGFGATAQLIRHQWQTVIKKDYDERYYYASEKTETKEWEQDFTINSSPYNLNFRVQISGKYELRIYKKGMPDYIKTEFYVYGWTTASAASFEVNKEGTVEIIPDKNSYQPGEKAKILFTCPFSGRMLVTIERNGVYEHNYIDAKNKSAELKLKIKDEFMPNVFITATLFRENSADMESPFFVGHGFHSIKVEKKSNKLPVSIIAPKQVKPNSKQKITIKTLPEKNIFVTLAAVDEGILQIRNFKTPDPYNYMYAKRSLRVESYDLYKMLLPEITAASSRTGGGEEGALSKAERRKRTNPITVKRFNLLAFWSGILKTNSSGTVSIPLNIPQFNGEVRLMAVAYSGSRFGCGMEYVKVTDDIIIESQIPRFLSSGDMLTSPVTIINTTKKGGNVNIKLDAEGPVYTTNSNTKTIYVQPNSTATAEFVLRAKNESGVAKIKIETSGLGKATESIELSVKPASPLITETGSGSIKGGGATDIKIPAYFMKGTQNTTLTISQFPAIKFGKQLKYLIGYPYGCIEQTISKLFPQLYFADLAKTVAPDMFKNQNPIFFVKEGIRKIESMQMYDGSMEYWQGCGYTNWWGSVYAAHFLIEAQKAGYVVSENVLKKLMRYIDKQAKSQKTFDYVSYQGNRRTFTKIANKEIFYSLYVLALAGKGDFSTMNYYKGRQHLLSVDGKYMLAASYALMNKWSSYYSTVPKDFHPEITDRLSGGCFDSEIRTNAIILNVLLEVDGSNKQIPSLIKYLSGKIKDVYSTQEAAFSFLALGKAARMRTDNKVAVDVFLDGRLYKTYNGNSLNISDNKLNYSKISLKAKGSGEAWYFWSTEGVRTDTRFKDADLYIKVRRKYTDLKTGGTINNNTFSQGQLLSCTIFITTGSRSVENVAITDIIPAGFEIENPRLSQLSNLTEKNDKLLVPDYLDVRDDRLLLFTSLNSNSAKEYTFLLRVVNQGEYALAPIVAEAMYDPEYRSVNGFGKVKVLSISNWHDLP